MSGTRASGSQQATVAQKTWEASNGIQPRDHIYHFDEKAHKREIATEPWKNDANHFKHVKISALALLKMVMHARSGKNIEVMGMMQGKVEGDTIIVMDAFALPVEGTETRVNASQQGYEYMVNYTSLIQEVGRKENAVGWYHSHPGYGCWLSGIDVATQRQNQQFMDPFCAVVVDPIRTMSAGKVELGAFRTYTEGYNAPNASRSEYQTIPTEKLEDFGVHMNSYYKLDVSYFKSSYDTMLLERLWNKYWTNTLSSSVLTSNAGYITSQIVDLQKKIKGVKTSVGIEAHNDKDSQLKEISCDSGKIGNECLTGMVNETIKSYLF